MKNKNTINEIEERENALNELTNEAMAYIGFIENTSGSLTDNSRKIEDELEKIEDLLARLYITKNSLEELQKQNNYVINKLDLIFSSPKEESDKTINHKP